MTITDSTADYLIIYCAGAIEFINYLECIADFCEELNTTPIFLRYRGGLHDCKKECADDDIVLAFRASIGEANLREMESGAIAFKCIDLNMAFDIYRELIKLRDDSSAPKIVANLQYENINGVKLLKMYLE